MSEPGELSLTLQDHEKALTEISFLLEILVTTAGEVVGKSTPSLGINAGRHMARKLPLDLAAPDLDEVLTALAQQMAAGYEIQSRLSERGADVDFGRCAIREVCKNRQLPLGGDLCKMFHSYFCGMTAQLLGKPVRVGSIRADVERCTVELQAAKSPVAP